MKDVKNPGAWALLRERNSRSAYLLLAMGAVCALLYYFGELVDALGWTALRWEFFYSVHDTQRLFFFAPIIYAGYVFGNRAVLMVTIISLGTMMPRALAISPFPDPIVRPFIFCLVAVAIGVLTARVRSQAEDQHRLETLLRKERDSLLGLLNAMDDGVFITGPDYRIRFVNPSMVREFGQGVGLRCFEFLYKTDMPCYPSCKLPSVLNGKVEKRSFVSSQGTVYDVRVSPCTDAEGVTCQLAVFRKVTPDKANSRETADSVT